MKTVIRYRFKFMPCTRINCIGKINLFSIIRLGTRKREMSAVPFSRRAQSSSVGRGKADGAEQLLVLGASRRCRRRHRSRERHTGTWRARCTRGRPSAGKLTGFADRRTAVGDDYRARSRSTTGIPRRRRRNKTVSNVVNFVRVRRPYTCDSRAGWTKTCVRFVPRDTTVQT